MPRIGSKQLNSSMNEYVLMCAIASKGESSIYSKLSSEDMQKYASRTKQLARSHWHTLPTSESLEIGSDVGYFGVAYYKFHHREKVVEIVIAHRGTILHTENIISELRKIKKIL